MICSNGLGSLMDKSGEFGRFMAYRIIMCHFVACFGVDVWKRYKKNVEDDKGHSVIRFLCGFLNCPSYIITSGFLWSKSPEGHNFWMEINGEWMRFLSQKEQ